MRKIMITAAIALPLAGIAAYALAATGDSAVDRGPDTSLSASASEFASADFPVLKPGPHKRLSIKGVFLDDEDDGDGEMEGGEGMDGE